MANTLRDLVPPAMATIVRTVRFSMIWAGPQRAANRLSDPLKTIREVGGAAAPDLNQRALLQGDDAEALWRGCKRELASGAACLRAT